MKNTLLIIIASVLFFSCEKDVDIDIPDKGRKIVVNSVFDNDFPIELTLHRSLYILDNGQFRVISDAGVYLYENDLIKDTLKEAETKGLYISSVYPKPGFKYKIKVNDNNEIVDSECTMPQVISIANIDTQSITREGEKYLRLSIQINDEPGVKNYYRAGIVREGWFYNNEENYEDMYYFMYYETTDLSVSDNYDGTKLFTDNLFDGKVYTFNMDIHKGHLYNNTDSINTFIILENLSEAYYLYTRSSSQQMYLQGNPFSEPVIVYSNINNGYGIFAGASRLIKYFKLPAYEVYEYNNKGKSTAKFKIKPCLK